MTELGDAELAEQGVMALSGHKTPQAARLYVKRTELQRARAALKRRAWVKENASSTRVEMEDGSESRNDNVETPQVPGIIGAGDGNRTHDTQLRKLQKVCQPAGLIVKCVSKSSGTTRELSKNLETCDNSNQR